jgi:hypothetical protein
MATKKAQLLFWGSARKGDQRIREQVDAFAAAGAAAFPHPENMRDRRRAMFRARRLV